MRTFTCTIHSNNETELTLLNEDGNTIVSKTFTAPPTARVPGPAFNPTLEEMNLPVLTAEEIEALHILITQQESS